MVKSLYYLPDPAVTVPGLYSQRALPDGGQERFQGQVPGYSIIPAQPEQCCGGDDDTFQLAGAHPAQAAVHVAAYVADLEVRAHVPELGCAAQAAGAYP